VNPIDRTTTEAPTETNILGQRTDAQRLERAGRPFAPIFDPLSGKMKGWTVAGAADLPPHANGDDPTQLVWVVGFQETIEADWENGHAPAVWEALRLVQRTEAFVIREARKAEAEGDEIDAWDALYEVAPAWDLLDPMDAARALIEY